MNVAQLLTNSAIHFPKCTAVSIGCEPHLDYAALHRRSACLSTSLREHAGETGCVAVALPNCTEYLEILFGIWRAGLSAAPMNARLSAIELAYMIQDCGASIVFATREQISSLSPLLSTDIRLIAPGSNEYSTILMAAPGPQVERDRDDLAWVFYTSGTTGKPKGAMLSHGNLMAMAMAYYADVDSLDEHDALIHIAATSHASGLFGLSFIARASNNIFLKNNNFEVAELITLINNYSNLSFFMPPTLLRRLDNFPELLEADTTHVKTVLVGAAPITPRDLHNAHALFGPKLWNGYGQGESPCTITALSKSMIARAIEDGDDSKLSSVGIARTGTAVAILDDAGHELSSGEIGEVAVRGSTVMIGYLNRPQDTSKALLGGWLRTGDVGRLDENGFLTLLDRKKDVIISGGMNIYAREIEDTLSEAAGVSDVAVIGIPDLEWGESVVAVVVPSEQTPIHRELDQFCLERIARFKRPKYYAFVDELPRNASGKVLKRQLREDVLDSGVSALLTPD